ncbi:hypothetical protein CDL12_07132 [Handroanthus impetiginosus]|uniref:Uncharacterized protein n=1 Tax=Handroanthus impetiginosus TaxID=429701 RepID=A0A2G9HS99_9LAMI|nr:hypothetical protein CDL12_07132 [Handroanthus impetiginosus]
MSLQDEDRRSLEEGSEKNDVVPMNLKISYSREYLLSLSNLDICKKLPSGFDQSLISEFEDALIRLPDRPGIPGSQSLQGFRRNEYSSSPPTRGTAGNYSRGIYGKWESRGRSDRDSDSQSDRDSDSGRRYGHQSRRSWQTPEHDGLLGSGSFPRPSGYTAGISALKGRANEQNQLIRSNEPYHPPRPYKAVPHSRRDTDSYNDETFGSIECASEDRAEEERRRRASFEMMRKEQQKALQDKQKLNLEKHKAGDVSDIFEEEKGLPVRNNELEVSAATLNLSSDLEKSSFASHAPASRPLVPPGFKSNSVEKSSGLTPLIHSPLLEVVKPVAGESLVDPDTNRGLNTSDGLERQLSRENSIVGGQPAEKIEQNLLLNNGESVNVHVRLDVSIAKPGVEDQLLHVSSKLDSEDPEITELNVVEDKTVRDSNRTSILEKLFGSTLSVNDAHSSSPEHHDSKTDDTWSPKSVQSSKFAQWFFEEETKAAADVSAARPNDLLSLIVSGDKADGVADQVCINNKKEAVPTVLTCEDLEQSILSEYSAKTTNARPVSESWSATATETEQTSANVDDHASLQLLSMLQKSNTNVNSGVDFNLDERRLVSQELDTARVVNEPKGEENGKISANMGNALTLETLFGSAFMKELQSIEAPLSLQRGSIGSARVDATEPRGLPFPVADNGISSPMIDKSGLQKQTSNHRQHAKLSETGKWLHFDDFQLEMTSSKLHNEAGPREGGAQGVVDFQLPEEENLISAGDIQDHQKLTFMPTGNSTNGANLSSNTPINITEKLSAFGAAVKDERNMESSERLPFAHNSYEQMEPGIPYHSLQVQQSPPLFQAPQMSQVGPLHHHSVSHPAHLSSQMKFLGQEPIFNHDSPANPQFSSNMIRPPFHHPNVRVGGFDVPSHHSMPHQMQVPVNNPPHFPRGGAVSHHGNQATNFIQEMNQMQGFPFGPNQPNIGSHGVPMPGNTPEALQRLIEMELRAKSKQIHPLAAGHSQGMYGNEVDLGFRYR